MLYDIFEWIRWRRLRSVHFSLGIPIHGCPHQTFLMQDDRLLVLCDHSSINLLFNPRACQILAPVLLFVRSITGTVTAKRRTPAGRPCLRRTLALMDREKEHIAALLFSKNKLNLDIPGYQPCGDREIYCKWTQERRRTMRVLDQ